MGYDATGATFLAMLAVAWLAADGHSRLAELAALAGSMALPIADVASDPANYQTSAAVYMATGSLFLLVHRADPAPGAVAGRRPDRRPRTPPRSGCCRRAPAHRPRRARRGGPVTGARRVLTLDPAGAADALDRAERVGRDSLDSLRSVVALPRSPTDAGAAGPPAPGAVDIAAMAGTAADAGLAVEVEVEGDLHAVDPYAGLAAFRLVQEAITNVEHHAAGAAVAVRVVTDGDHLRVVVRNGPSDQHTKRSASGVTGLVGMRERIEALGGVVSAGPDGGGWRVEASIPLRRPGVPASA